jgi:hypothetical protein
MDAHRCSGETWSRAHKAELLQSSDAIVEDDFFAGVQRSPTSFLMRR